MNDQDYDEEPGFFSRYRIPVGIVAMLAIGGGTWKFMSGGEDKPKPKPVQQVEVFIPPPPPKPTPTPPPVVKPPDVKPKEPPKIAEKKPVEAPREKVIEQPKEAPKPEEPKAMNTAIAGKGGPSGLAQGNSDGGMIGGRGTGNGPGGGGGAGTFYGQLRARVESALKRDPRTKKAVFNMKVRLRVDPASGRLSVEMAESTNNPELDQIISREILPNIQLPTAPANLPRLAMRIEAKRPAQR